VTSLSGHFYPYLETTAIGVIWKAVEPQEISPDDGLPIPPGELHAGYGRDAAAYLAVGREHHQKMMEIMKESGFVLEEGGRILDFGCAGGRVVRCFKSLADRHEIWGVDIRADHIFWCQSYLSPPFRFTTTTTYPHLPFEDNSFSFIYALSVFTHIGDLEDAWLLELRRILRPGGRLFATVHDNHTLDLLMTSPPGHWLHDSHFRHLVVEAESRAGFWKSAYCMASVNLDPGTHQVFHDLDFLKQRWSRFFTIGAIHPEGHGYQTAVVLIK
jgi:SAM-dependent methyltransferase